ncbi:MAG TPA: malectin domain-containing carbohydrate-binding protein [Phycisphaerae bacterium]|nr:malectin domain-containing carbohydrate-binding protein [Phycisphaerae bacterium]HRY69243.1 malectin domain-containing carbohydrate-binding protein [Phycisphaerae bacterium]HSA26561.1 malectin domain-containing carbohydrate-binding protein [Phycisphaerae bacterium]
MNGRRTRGAREQVLGFEARVRWDNQMRSRWGAAGGLLAGAFMMLPCAAVAPAAEVLKQYYAHSVVEDGNGVIAPWHQGRNGQFDARLRIAADIYKRYPWTDAGKAVIAAPHIVYNTHWSIAEDGTISIPPTDPWMCGDLSQRAYSIIQGLTAYYQYSGDPMAFVYVPLIVDYILDYCLTGPDHPWPRFPISTPTKGIGYRRADPNVPNQLDLCAYLGIEVIRAYKLTGNERYLQAARHWGDVLAQKCNLTRPDLPPWSRYMSPEHMLWSDELTGGTALIGEFLDALIDGGHTGEDGSIVKARDAARRFLAEHVLPHWTDNEAWGRHYWDVEGDWYSGGVVWMCDYFLSHPDAFPNWQTDVRNILSLVFSRNCADPSSRGDMYSGAWAFPESYVCCGTSLSYNQYTYAPTFLAYGEMAHDDWAREVGRRMLLMATYDSTVQGVVKDGLTGNVVAAAEWLNLAHPWPMSQIFKAMVCRPDIFAPARESHIIRCGSVVTSVVYDKGSVSYTTFDAPGKCVDSLRLALKPKEIKADNKTLRERNDLNENGYTVSVLPGGDCLVNVRHDGLRELVITGDDAQEVVEDDGLAYHGNWTPVKHDQARSATLHVTTSAGATAACSFVGNQVRLTGATGPKGGLAEVYLDGVKQLTFVDCWTPRPRNRQELYARGGLAGRRHELKIVALGKGNPQSKGAEVGIDAVQFTVAEDAAPFGEGEGPTGPQRMIFGYTGRKDYSDSRGNTWRPGLEYVIRSGYGVDAFLRASFVNRRSMHIAGTADPEIYRYGLHGKDYWLNLTVGPGEYEVVLHLADTNLGNTLTATVNGREVARELSVAKAAGGTFRAHTISVPQVRPAHGTIDIHFKGTEKAEATIQAIEILPR